jgi:hypothetical protein
MIGRASRDANTRRSCRDGWSTLFLPEHALSFPSSGRIKIARSPDVAAINSLSIPLGFP